MLIQFLMIYLWLVVYWWSCTYRRSHEYSPLDRGTFIYAMEYYASMMADCLLSLMSNFITNNERKLFQQG